MIDFSLYSLDLFKGHLYKGDQKCGYKRQDGYYDVHLKAGTTIRLHRLIYMFLWGDIPEGLVIDHKDNNRSNNIPWNLQAITQSENVAKEKNPKTGFHNIYLIDKNVYIVQVKHKGPQRRFRSLELALEYQDYLFSLPSTAQVL